MKKRGPPKRAAQRDVQSDQANCNLENAQLAIKQYQWCDLRTASRESWQNAVCRAVSADPLAGVLSSRASHARWRALDPFGQPGNGTAQVKLFFLELP